jgi:hypothetical protein
MIFVIMCPGVRAAKAFFESKPGHPLLQVTRFVYSTAPAHRSMVHAGQTGKAATAG